MGRPPMRLYFDMVWSWFSLIGYMHCKNFVILIRDQRAPKIPCFVIWHLPCLVVTALITFSGMGPLYHKIWYALPLFWWAIPHKMSALQSMNDRCYK